MRDQNLLFSVSNIHPTLATTAAPRPVRSGKQIRQKKKKSRRDMGWKQVSGSTRSTSASSGPLRTGRDKLQKQEEKKEKKKKENPNPQKLNDKASNHSCCCPTYCPEGRMGSERTDSDFHHRLCDVKPSLVDCSACTIQIAMPFSNIRVSILCARPHSIVSKSAYFQRRSIKAAN